MLGARPSVTAPKQDSAGYTDPRFRHTAIEALEPMVQNPAVQQWLGHLAQSDPEPKLAARAGRALGITPPATTATSAKR